jgi:hypothetical protein
VELEQYPTGPHIASRMLYTVSAALASCSDSDAYPALLREGRMLSFSSRDGSGMRCGALLWCEWNYGIGCQCHQVHSFGSASA